MDSKDFFMFWFTWKKAITGIRVIKKVDEKIVTQVIVLSERSE